MIRFMFFAMLLFCHLAAAQQSARTIFVVRHAEKSSGAPDGPLSPAGHQRAACLAQVLKDSSIRRIFVSDIKATQQTAVPLANALKITPTVVPSHNTSTLVRDLLYSGIGNALVIGDRDTVPVLIPRLQAGVTKPFAENEYERMYVITIMEGSGPPAVNLLYCPSAASDQGTTQIKPRKAPAGKSITKRR